MCIHGLRPGPQHRCVPASSCGGCWKEHWPFPQEWTCYHRFYSCLHINKAHTCDMLIPGMPRYAGIFHMPSQGRAWQESLPQCIWDRDSCPIPPRLFLFPFLCCPLLPVLGIIPTISLSCTPLFRIHSALESCRVDRSFPSPSQSPAALSHRVFQCPTLTCFTLSASSCSFQSAFRFPLGRTF